MHTFCTLWEIADDIAGLGIVRMVSGKHICILRTHRRNIVHHIRCRCIAGDDLGIHPLETASGECHTKAAAVVSEFEELRIALLLEIPVSIGRIRIVIVLVTCSYPLCLCKEAVGLEISPS